MPTLAEPAAYTLVTDVLVRELEIDPSRIGPEASLIETLDMDSLSLIELSQILEERFDAKIEQDRAERVKTVADVISLVIELSDRNAVGPNRRGT